MKKQRPLSLQNWRTPRQIFATLNEEVGGYGIDLFADDENHLCDTYFTEHNSALDHHWKSSKIAFGNPPYAHGWTKAALDTSIREVRAGRLPGVDLLLKCDTSTKAFLEAFTKCEIHLFHKRIQFELDPVYGVATNSNNFASMLVRVRRDGPIGVTSIRSGDTGALI